MHYDLFILSLGGGELIYLSFLGRLCLATKLTTLFRYLAFTYEMRCLMIFYDVSFVGLVGLEEVVWGLCRMKKSALQYLAGQSIPSL